MYLQAGIVVNRALEHVWAFLEDPRNLARWDRSVAQVVVTSAGPLGVGSTFDTIGPSASSSREGQRSSYRVTGLEVHRFARTDLVNSRLFTRATWLMRLEPATEGTSVVCSVDMAFKWTTVFLAPILWLNRGALFKDLTYFKKAIEGVGESSDASLVRT